jgi:hypothetical protein
MNAFGRLWVRAPLWRRALFIGCAGTAMAIAWPPAWLRGGTDVTPEPRAVVGQSSPPAARQAPSAPVPANGKAVPVAGEFYVGRLPLGDQAAPLPPGRWLVFAVSGPGAAQTGTAPRPSGPPAASAFLGLVLGGRVAAIAVIGGSIESDPGQAGFGAQLEMQNPAFYYRRVLSAVDHAGQDVWICGTTQPANWNDALRKAALGAIRQQALDLPPKLESVVFRFADKRNWLSAEFMFTDPAGDSTPARPWTGLAPLSETAALPHIEKVRRWGKAWHTVMRRGFEGGAWTPDEARIALP